MAGADRRDAAARWLIALKMTDDIESIWPAFVAWLEEAPENRSAYRELEEVACIVKRARSSIGQHPSQVAEQCLGSVGATRGRHRLGLRWAIVATLACTALIAGGILFTSKRAPRSAWRYYETRQGDLLRVTLADGSFAQMNAGSRIGFRVTTQSREVRLDQGEVRFAVTADLSRPFIVCVDKVVLRAIGTNFSVRRESEDVVNALVSEGHVEVSYPSRRGSSRNGTSAERMVAAAGQELTIKSGHVVIEALDSAAMDRRLAWTKLLIDLDGTLADAVAELNRYNTRQLKIADPKLATKHVQGTFKAMDPKAFCLAIHKSLGLLCSSTGEAQSGVIRVSE
jgi:transmembrane sensor